ncbi:hypothetical protein GCM10010106_18420 [Thermopolyspora flexuosa]|uniref:Small secreted domain DUF320 n=1 Tax=Thermopolyspora flexuosa TaxID=103836 RepID=A0A543J418_9ACTN|nr:chaplin family protein [Thermopolyspora flexuosa]TQM77571.1 small secreted domain DUF320 [Thermopolyspora flexuosa]GGM72380.1 hypothetical protein GCM10010106_18420 [Thermopolyspora flexuosa]
MRTWAKGAKPAALLALGVMALTGGGTAWADTDGRYSIGGGNQIDLPVTLPVDISGNAIGILGDANAASRGGASVENGPGSGAGGNRTSGRSSILGGNQVVAPITAPVNACGNAVSLFGSADAACQGGAKVKSSGRGGSGSGAGGNRTSGRSSILGGNQVVAPITAPVNACGNAVGVLGEAAAGCKGGAKVKSSGRGGSGSGAGGNRTSGRSSILGGNQVVAPITAPVNVCGNSVAALGGAFSGCKGGAKVKQGGDDNGYGGRFGRRAGGRGSGGNDTDGRFGVGSGNQVVAPITAPVNACGNAVGNGAAGCKGGVTVKRSGGSGSGAGGNRTSGRSSILGGNQVVAPITAPVNVCGNAVAVLGNAFAGCKGGAEVVGRGSGAGGNRTSGRSSILGGNQIVAPITAPVNVCGNAVAVLGRSEAACLGGAKVVGGGSGAGGNRTSGVGSILGGNQIVAPITAPVNACGNAVAVLGDAAAGCLGSAKVVSSSARGLRKVHHAGLLSAAPVKPAKKAAHPVQPGRPKLPKATGHRLVPVPGGVPQLPGQLAPLPGGLTELPNLPLVSNLPIGKAPASGGSATDILPIKLVSAEETAKPAGMDAGAFLTMALGTLFAATTAFFAFTRRFRFGRR